MGYVATSMLSPADNTRRPRTDRFDKGRIHTLKLGLVGAMRTATLPGRATNACASRPLRDHKE